MHREIQKDLNNIFTWRFYSDGIQIIPSSATVSIYDKGGTAKVTTANVGIDSEGTMTYTFLAADNNDDDRNFKTELIYVVSGVSKYVYELFDVVIHPISNLVRDEDLFSYLPELRKKIYNRVGETSSVGTTTTLIDTNLKSDQRDWTGGFVEIYIDNSTVHESRITGYAKAIGTITFNNAYGSAIASGLRYRVRTSYQNIIDKAYNNHVHKDIRNKVGIKAGYIDSNVTENLTVYKALEMYALGAIEEDGDKWDIRHKKFSKLYQEEYTAFSEPYDTDEDGNISETENEERPNMSIIDMER